ncbi:serine/arginine repetitive matrix protein 2-like [Centruroides sculpturatus]|uniref:serine/arginine repetitive matrix protein 2-like n=2 Tax=Centruroides sculpturatus TaxID=218467 RepID=UPI000C6D41A5|nr:serine/arginine repetitive matrix protein 2-like [Centruroides sculpturatus]
MLGFYVSFTATRWWNQYVAIPWPDKLMNIIAMYVPGVDETSRMVRRTLMRYLNLSLVLVLRSISMAVKRRFPTRDHLVEAGFLTKTELDMFESVPSTEFNTFWIPCTWFITLLRDAKKDCRITDSNGVKLIMEELNEFRSKCGLLWGYDWISVPLVYTQVVTIATYAFYFACILGRQYVNSPEKILQEKVPFDCYFPVFTVLEILFYMGLLKVAEQLINPFGDDDEDFELNWIIDRHMKVSYLGVDTLNSEPPPLVKDSYYDELDVKLPYTEASLSYKKKTYRGSVAYMQVPMEQQGLVLPDIREEEENREQQGMGSRRPSIWTIFGSKLNNSQRPSITGSYAEADIIADYAWRHSTSSFNASSENVAQSNGDRKNSSGTGGTRDGDLYQESSSQDLPESMMKYKDAKSGGYQKSSESEKPPRSQQAKRNGKSYKSLFKKNKQPSVDQYYEVCRKWKMRSVSPCKTIKESHELQSDPQHPHPSVQITVSSPPSNGEESVKLAGGRPVPLRSSSLNIADLWSSKKPKLSDRRQAYKEKKSQSSSSACSQDTVTTEFHSMPNVQEGETEIPVEKPCTPVKEPRRSFSGQSSRDHKILRQNAIRRPSTEKQESSSSEDYRLPPEILPRNLQSSFPEEEATDPAGGYESTEKRESKPSRIEGPPECPSRKSPARRSRPGSREQKKVEKRSREPVRQRSSESPTPRTTETSVSEGSKSSTASIPTTSNVVSLTIDKPDTVISVEDRQEFV